ncbi:MAG: hypothetical protein ACI9FB_001831 [Candidatus Azotimanducaceae bacterium]|jgi:uncharacterized protein with NAD-binding domain and iron-sulfur cluster
MRSANMEFEEKKVVILGGGMGSLTTAFELAKQKNASGQAKFDITVYQLGWRLGGKLATGRNREKGDRIEEHGIHGFLGCYYNAGEMMSEIFTKLSAIKNLTGFYTTFDDAFLQQNSVVMWEPQGDKWHPWKVTAPPNKLSYSKVHEVADYKNRIVGLLNFIGVQLVSSNEKALKSLGESLLKDIEVAASEKTHLAEWVVEHIDKIWLIVRPLLEFYLKIDPSDKVRQLLILIDFNCALITGFFNDDISKEGFASIDNQNYADWLRSHGACEMTLASSFTKNTPDITYNFKDGDTQQDAVMAAGSFLQWSLILYGYIGSFVLAFKAGSGESVMAPMYRCLREMGVKFEFFHKVSRLNVSTKEKTIQSVDIDVQATVKKGVEYQPLFGPVGDLMCWPSTPLYDQLVEGAELKSSGVNLESWWSPWGNVGVKTLQAGRDYDHLVLGISIGAHQFICQDLINDESNKPLAENSRYRSRWAAMVSEIETVQTQAMQLWFKKPVPAYLVQSPQMPGLDKWISGTYAVPVQGQADFSDLIPVESWPEDGPKGILYICGPKKDTGFPPFSETDFPMTQSSLVRQTSIDYLNAYSGPVLPGATVKSGTTGDAFDFNCLYSPLSEDLNLDVAFEYQYWRANIDPTERYVTAFPGASQYRLNAWESGYSNLSLTGDWINTGLNVGSMEGTVMGGKLCAYAISGSPPIDKIYGYDPFGLCTS